MIFKKNKVYKVSFLDHCIGLDRPMSFDVVGFFVSEGPNYIVLTSWLMKSRDKALVEENYERSVILKSTIKKIVEI